MTGATKHKIKHTTGPRVKTNGDAPMKGNKWKGKKTKRKAGK